MSVGICVPCRHFSSKLVLLQEMWRQRGSAKTHRYSVSTDHYQMISQSWGEREKQLFNVGKCMGVFIKLQALCSLWPELWVLRWPWVILGRQGFPRICNAIFSLFWYGLASLTLNFYPCGAGPSRQHGQAHVLGQWVMNVAVLFTFCSQLE